MRPDISLAVDTKRENTGRMKPKFHANERQLIVLASPRRAEIFQHIAALGPLTATKLAQSLSLPVTSLYHHLKALVETGIIQREVQSNAVSVRGRPAVRYRAKRRSMYLTTPMKYAGHNQPIRKVVRASAVQAVRDFSASLGSAAVLDGPTKNVSFFRALFVASAKDLRRVNALLEELRSLTLSRRPAHGQLLSITWLMSPPARRRKNR